MVHATLQKIRQAQIRIQTSYDLPSPVFATSLARDLRSSEITTEFNIIGTLINTSVQSKLSESLAFVDCLYQFLVSSSLLNAKRKNAAFSTLTTSELEALRYWSGSKLFGHLDRQMSPRALNSRNKDQLDSLFLVVLGTIIAINYNEPSMIGCHAGAGEERSAASAAALSLLGHYLAYIGLRTNIIADQNVARDLLDHAKCNWHLFNRVTTLPESEAEVKAEEAEHHELHTNNSFDHLEDITVKDVK